MGGLAYTLPRTHASQGSMHRRIGTAPIGSLSAAYSSVTPSMQKTVCRRRAEHPTSLTRWSSIPMLLWQLATIASSSCTTATRRTQSTSSKLAHGDGLEWTGVRRGCSGCCLCTWAPESATPLCCNPQYHMSVRCFCCAECHVNSCRQRLQLVFECI